MHFRISKLYIKKIKINYINIILSITAFAFIQVSVVNAQEFVKSDFLVSDYSGNNFPRADISVSSSGDMIVAWENVAFGGMRLKKISSMGIAEEQKEIPVPMYYDGIKIVHANNGKFMTIYGGYGNMWSLYGQLYEPDATEIGDVLNINQNYTEIIDVSEAGLFVDNDKQFAVLFPDSYKIMVKKISESGEFLGNPIELRPDASKIFNLQGIMTPAGQFILVWYDELEGNIFGIRYRSDGKPIGAEFQVSETDSLSHIQNLTMACDTAGNFSVAWIAEKDRNWHIYSQVFNFEGVKVGSNTKVTDDSAVIYSINGKMSLDMDLNGNFVIAWPDNRNNNLSSVYIQQMNKYGEPEGVNYLATTINNGVSANVKPTPGQRNVSVEFLRDTLYLVWANYNSEVSANHTIFSNIQKWQGPDINGLRHQKSNLIRSTCYPNPSSGIYLFSMNYEYSGPITLSVYNSLGRLIQYNNSYWIGSEKTIDLSEEAEGIYHLRIEGVGFDLNHTLIKTR